MIYVSVLWCGSTIHSYFCCCSAPLCHILTPTTNLLIPLSRCSQKKRILSWCNDLHAPHGEHCRCCVVHIGFRKLELKPGRILSPAWPKNHIFGTEVRLLPLKSWLTLPNEVVELQCVVNVWFAKRIKHPIHWSQAWGWITSWNNWAHKSQCFIMPIGFTVCNKSISARRTTDVASARTRWWSRQVSPKWAKLFNN